jgi:hypothetical protein
MPINPLLLSRETAGSDRKYKVTLRPGQVRYIRFLDFVRAESVDEVIGQIQRASDEPLIESPAGDFTHNISDMKFAGFEFYDLDKLLGSIRWTDRLRIHYALGKLLLEIGMSSWVYCEFHCYLKLERHFAIAECAEAWVKKTVGDRDLAQSFIESPEHLVIKCDMFKYAVFRKTAFVLTRLDALAEEKRLEAEEAARKLEHARTEQEARRIAALADQLRRSSFNTFV